MWITPSVIDISYFMSGKHVRFAEIPATGGPVVGLFRPSRLGDLRRIFVHFSQKRMHVTFLGDDYAYNVLGDDLVTL